MEKVKTPQPTSAEDTAGKSKPSNKKRLSLVLIALLLLVGLGAVGIIAKKHHDKELARQNAATTEKEIELANNAYSRNDNKEALIHAKKAVDASPSDTEALELEAVLEKDVNPTKSKQLYAQELAAYKNQNHPDAPNARISTLWGAANIAEEAGDKQQAVQYYQKVVARADRTKPYDNYLYSQSMSALVRLQ